LSAKWQSKIVVCSGYLELGMLEEAARILGEIDPHDRRRKEVLHAQLELAIAANQWNSAVATAASFVRSHPEDSAGWLDLARAITKTANAEYAEAVLTKACKWHPEIALLILDQAREATALGCLPEAKIWLKCANHLEGSVRKSALRDLRLKPLWKWIEAIP
jgi:cytochrome c-type biogenesis protein CcmH/NrfG